MTAYYASFVPVMREEKTKILSRKTPSSEPSELEVDGALGLVSLLKPKDELFLMMGSTNAALALGALRKGVKVHQISYVRAKKFLTESSEAKSEDKKIKISPRHISQIAEFWPDLFYPTFAHQTEVLGISTAWQKLEDAMEARKAYANLKRSRLQFDAVISGGMDPKELKRQIEEQVGLKNPQDPFMQAFLAEENALSRELERVINRSGLYQEVFSPIKGVGPRIAARVIAAIERIERFLTAADLIRYGGFSPTRDGKLPSRKRGVILNRSPKLNVAGYLLQDQMATYGINTTFGQMIRSQVEEECPCTPEERKGDKELRRRYAGAMKRARINMTRAFLEQIWMGWRLYFGLPLSTETQGTP